MCVGQDTGWTCRERKSPAVCRGSRQDLGFVINLRVKVNHVYTSRKNCEYQLTVDLNRHVKTALTLNFTQN